jgi:hypothetical protein
MLKKDLTVREHLKTIQSDGGKARWAKLTPEERSAHGSQRLSYPCLIAYFRLTATLTITTPVMARKVKIVRAADWVPWGVSGFGYPFEPISSGVAENVRLLNFRASTLLKTFRYSPAIQGVGVDRLRRAVGTFRNVIVAR